MLSNKTFETKGQNGGKIIADTATYTGDWCEIRVISAAVFTTLTGNVTDVGSTSFPANFVLTGKFTTIDLASGAVFAVNAA